jgi:methylmalonyl-CoA mutase N-terminal domain/subunit
VDDSIRKQQMEKIALLKAERDSNQVNTSLLQLKTAAEGTENLMPFLLEAVENYATLGEIADTLRNIFGEY